MARKDSSRAEKIREDVRKWDNYFRTNNAIYHEMTQFIMGEQWAEKESRLFEDYKKVPLTVNKLAPQMNHLLGEQRQNTPNLQIDPEDDVEEQTADVRAALIKDISLNSAAATVYQNAFEQAACGGYGAYRIYTDYENDRTFNQYIGIGGFRDPTKCFWDIGAETPGKVDGMYSGFRTVMTRKKFRSLYGKKIEKQVGATSTDITTADDLNWSFSDENTITVIDYYKRSIKNKTLKELSNGDAMLDDEFNDLQDIEIEGKTVKLDAQGMPVTVVRERTVQSYSVEHSKWAGDWELETAKFPSKQLPVIFVDQHSYYDKKGKQIIRSFFKDAKDSQRFLNYLRTQSAYLIKISRYDQFMASKANVKSGDTLQAWRDPQTVKGALFYDESPNGNKPEQIRPPELSQSLMMQTEMASNDIQATTGMFDTQMGEQGNETSGKAINARVKRGNYNTYIPFDSLNRAIAVGGEIINEMIPEVYDTERRMQLELKDVGKTKISINKPADDYGINTENDMTKGNFKIRLIPGQSIEGQKQENLDSMDRVFARQPETFGMISDLYVENLPIANRIEMRNRLRATIPPEIIEAGKSGKPIPPKPPQQDPMIALKQQELQMKMQQAQMQAAQKQKELEYKQEQLQMESHNEGVNYAHEMQKLKMQQEEAASHLQAEMLRYQGEMARIQADIHLGHSDNILKILTHQPDHLKPQKEHSKPEKKA